MQGQGEASPPPLRAPAEPPTPSLGPPPRRRGLGRSCSGAVRLRIPWPGHRSPWRAVSSVPASLPAPPRKLPSITIPTPPAFLIESPTLPLFFPARNPNLQGEEAGHAVMRQERHQVHRAPALADAGSRTKPGPAMLFGLRRSRSVWYLPRRGLRMPHLVAVPNELFIPCPAFLFPHPNPQWEQGLGRTDARQVASTKDQKKKIK